MSLLLVLWPQVESVWEQTLLDVMVPVGIIVLACVPTDTTRHGGFKIMVSAGHRALDKSIRHDGEGCGPHSVWVHFQLPMLVAHTELCTTMPWWLGHQAYVHSVASGVVFVVAPIVLLIKCIPRRRSVTIWDVLPVIISCSRCDIIHEGGPGKGGGGASATALSPLA